MRKFVALFLCVVCFSSFAVASETELQRIPLGITDIDLDSDGIKERIIRGQNIMPGGERYMSLAVYGNDNGTWKPLDIMTFTQSVGFDQYRTPLIQIYAGNGGCTMADAYIYTGEAAKKKETKGPLILLAARDKHPESPEMQEIDGKGYVVLSFLGYKKNEKPKKNWERFASLVSVTGRFTEGLLYCDVNDAVKAGEHLSMHGLFENNDQDNVDILGADVQKDTPESRKPVAALGPKSDEYHVFQLDKKFQLIPDGKSIVMGEENLFQVKEKHEMPDGAQYLALFPYQKAFNRIWQPLTITSNGGVIGTVILKDLRSCGGEIAYLYKGRDEMGSGRGALALLLTGQKLENEGEFDLQSVVNYESYTLVKDVALVPSSYSLDMWVQGQGFSVSDCAAAGQASP